MITLIVLSVSDRRVFIMIFVFIGELTLKPLLWKIPKVSGMKKTLCIGGGGRFCTTISKLPKWVFFLAQ